LKGLDYTSFNFDDESNLDHLRDIYLGAKAFPMKTFKDVERILGKAKRYETNYEGDTLISYELGNLFIEFTSDSYDETESINGIMISKRSKE
jgi:hypothetical protein